MNENQNRPDSSNRSERPRRSAVGGKRACLTVVGDKDPKFHYMFIKNTPSQIAEFESYGYKVDQDSDLSIGAENVVKTGSSHEVVVDRRTGEKNILMKQPMEFHREDQKLRAEKIAEGEADMLRNVKDADKGRYASMTIHRDGT